MPFPTITPLQSKMDETPCFSHQNVNNDSIVIIVILMDIRISG